MIPFASGPEFAEVFGFVAFIGIPAAKVVVLFLMMCQPKAQRGRRRR
jgi:hypothetical protein